MFQKARSFVSYVGARVGSVVALSLAAVGTASAALPVTDLADASSWMEDQGLIAIGVCATVTLIVIALKGTKLPRRG